MNGGKSKTSKGGRSTKTWKIDKSQNSSIKKAESVGKIGSSIAGGSIPSIGGGGEGGVGSMEESP